MRRLLAPLLALPLAACLGGARSGGGARSFQQLVAEAKAEVPQTSVAAVRERLARGEKLILIDVREDGEWALGRAAGARHLSRGVLERAVEKDFPDRSAELILYCASGGRSSLAAQSLRRMGYRAAVSMDGGFSGWVQAGGAVEK